MSSSRAPSKPGGVLLDAGPPRQDPVGRIDDRRDDEQQEGIAEIGRANVASVARNASTAPVAV